MQRDVSHARSSIPRSRRKRGLRQPRELVSHPQVDLTFPQPVAIGGGIGWLETEIDAWLAARPRVVKRDQASTIVGNKLA